MILLIVYLASIAVCLFIEDIFCKMIGMRREEFNLVYIIPIFNTIEAIIMTLSFLMWIGKGRQ